MKYVIREIEPRDNARVEAVIRSCLIEFGADHEGTAWADPDLGRFSEIYCTDGNRYWVAEDENGKIVGGAGIGELKDADGVCELQKMYCLPEARGIGVSHRLMGHALEYAVKYYDRCYLETLDNMIAAQRFYEKYGFIRTDEAVSRTAHFACDVRYIKNLRYCEKRSENGMNLIRTKLHVGAERPFSVLHLSDTHLTFADERDGERKVLLAEKRTRIFPTAAEVLRQAGNHAKTLGVPIVHTGDLIDFVSLANLEAAKAFTDAHDCFMAAGNHEFSLYVGEAWEDAAYRNQSLDTVQKAFKNNIRASSRVIEGVNFVALDNGYYLFEEEQLAFLKKEVERGLPVVLLCHTPLFDSALYDLMMSKQAWASLLAVPEELMQSYPEKRYRQQIADEITQKAYEYIKGEPAIKAIVTGHLHQNYEGTLGGRIPQIMTACTDARLLEID